MPHLKDIFSKRKLTQAQRHQLARVAYFNSYGRGVFWSVYDYGCTVDEVYPHTGPRKADIRYASERHLYNVWHIDRIVNIPSYQHIRWAKEETPFIRDKGMANVKSHSDIDEWLATMHANHEAWQERLRNLREMRGEDIETGIRLHPVVARRIGILRDIVNRATTIVGEREAAKAAIERLLNSARKRNAERGL